MFDHDICYRGDGFFEARRNCLTGIICGPCCDSSPEGAHHTKTWLVMLFDVTVYSDIGFHFKKYDSVIGFPFCTDEKGLETMLAFIDKIQKMPLSQDEQICLM